MCPVQNTLNDASGSSKNCPVVFVSRFLKLFDIWQKTDFSHVFNLKYQFFAFNWIHYQQICTIIGFLKMNLLVPIYGCIFFTCISEKFNLKFHKNWFLVVNFNFSKCCLLSKTNHIHIEGSAMPKSITISGH